uniref:Uncharacterized protein n=1 Tax=Ciona intestinalis TaxID=7719 RepID=H2XYS5_CIOIN
MTYLISEGIGAVTPNLQPSGESTAVVARLKIRVLSREEQMIVAKLIHITTPIFFVLKCITG